MWSESGSYRKNLGVFDEVLAPLCHSYPSPRPWWHLIEFTSQKYRTRYCRCSQVVWHSVSWFVHYGTPTGSETKCEPGGELKESVSPMRTPLHIVTIDCQMHLSLYPSYLCKYCAIALRSFTYSLHFIG